jgi:DNA-binding response OmpR family regulator
MNILLVSADLMIVSQVDSTARKQGGTVRAVASGEAAASAAKETAVSLIVIDLGNAAVDVSSLVAQLRAAQPAARIVAFGPHVHEAKLAAARDAGCDEVLSRGGFLSLLDSICGRGL